MVVRAMDEKARGPGGGGEQKMTEGGGRRPTKKRQLGIPMQRL